ncbi:hypothetical protein HMPREF9057_00036 [Actinomyces sp. oral taxon 171 str. F0337]|nr:hypothetical protein HMPREF9057_00036 [Actinomyces sp. oral taxon 171 str. F0337]
MSSRRIGHAPPTDRLVQCGKALSEGRPACRYHGVVSTGVRTLNQMP